MVGAKAKRQIKFGAIWVAIDPSAANTVRIRRQNAGASSPLQAGRAGNKVSQTAPGRRNQRRSLAKSLPVQGPTSKATDTLDA